MLTVTHLGHTYGVGKNSLEAIRDLTFTVDKGELVTIVGPSGAGKSTMLRSLSGLMRPTQGEVRINGELVTEPHPEMALVFQDYGRALMPWATIRANVEIAIKRKFPNAAERRWNTEESLQQVGLGDVADRYPWELSGGMQQRAALARGLAYRPSILLFDEPFASVDAQTRSDLEDLVLKICRDNEMTGLLVTHDIDEAIYLADRVLVVSKRPSSISLEVEVNLPRPRNQFTTKALPEFARLRQVVLNELHPRAAEPVTNRISTFEIDH